MTPARCCLSLLLGASLFSACGGDDNAASKSTEATPAASDASAAEDEGAGTGSSGTPGSPRAPRSRRGGGSSSEVELLDTRSVTSIETGALHGVIRFEGDPPKRFALPSKSKTECCKYDDTEHLSDVAIVNDGKIGNVYVYVKSGYDEAAVPAPSEADIVMDQRGCTYVPHVIALQIGQRLIVRNSDPTNHNVNAAAPRNSVFKNRNMGPGQDPLVFDSFTRAEHKILFKCDIHPWMLAYAHVQDHPWFAVTDADGAFEILDLPPGEYVVEAIHERFGKTSGKVTVTAGSSTGFAFTMSE